MSSKGVAAAAAAAVPSLPFSVGCAVTLPIAATTPRAGVRVVRLSLSLKTLPEKAPRRFHFRSKFQVKTFQVEIFARTLHTRRYRYATNEEIDRYKLHITRRYSIGARR